MANFPGSLPSFSNPSGSDYLNSPAHATQHSSNNDETVAVATKIGTGSSTPTANTVLKGSGTGTSAWSAVHTVETPQTYAPSAAGTATLDLSLGSDHEITMPAGNITIAISNATVGQKFSLSILQDSGGSRTVTWFSTIRWSGGSAPTLTTTASKRDWFGFKVTGSGTYDGVVVGQSI